MIRRIGNFLLRLFVSAGAMALILYFMRDKLADALVILHSDVNWFYFGVAALTYVVALFITSVRLKLIFEVQDIILRVTETCYLTLIGLFFNLFLPSAVGGDIAKAYYAYQHSGKKIASTTAVILDRLLGFVALIIMAVVSVGLNKDLDNPNVDRLVFIFLGVMIFAVVFFSSKRVARVFAFFKHLVPSEKWRARIAELYHSIYDYKNHRGVLLASVALSFVGQGLFISISYWMSRALGVEINPAVFFILVPVVTIISMAPSIGGLGVREAAIIYLFKRFMPSERALAMSVLLDILVYSFSLISGLIFAMRGGLKQKVMDEMEKLK